MDKITCVVTSDVKTYAISADGVKRSISDVIGVLNNYIDLGPLDRLCELAEADKDGRCVVLPDCKKCKYDGTVVCMNCLGAGIPQTDLFTPREAAEKALEAQK